MRVTVDVWLSSGGSSYHQERNCARLVGTVHPPILVTVPLRWFTPPKLGGILQIDAYHPEHRELARRLAGYTLRRGGCFVCVDR